MRTSSRRLVTEVYRKGISLANNLTPTDAEIVSSYDTTLYRIIRNLVNFYENFKLIFS